MNALTVSNLGKRYMIGHQTKNDTLRDALTSGVKGMWKSIRGMRQQREEFWALNDVSFSVQQGDVVGIVGRNGAGKSTLLKVLSRITEPTTGEIEITGRIASLLEVGTGFHPELSGRENIFLNGAVLGMRRREIREKFDEIVEFSGVERFLDTPVKRYSSGMYVRLAFAVAAHLEPEILIVDEVLAVGDAQFQKKCMGKIRSVAASDGRTVLLVTHNPSVVLALCNRALYLKEGRLEADGESSRIIANYLASGSKYSFEREAPVGAKAAITSASLRTELDGTKAKLMVRLRVQCAAALRCALEVKLHDAVGHPIAFSSLGSMTPAEQVDLPTGETDLTCAVDISGLAAGAYGTTLKLTIPFIESLDELANCLSFEHEFPASSGSTHVLQQAWGSGYFTLPATRDS